MHVSVIVPVRNSERTITECVEALRSQNYDGERIDVLVVDDGSIDQTAQRARAAGAEVLSIPPSGPAAARNRGSELARGEALLFTDGDCVPDPDWVRRMVAPFSDECVIATKGAYRSTQRQLTARFVQLEYESRYDRMRNQSTIDFVDTYAAAFRTRRFHDVGGFDESFPGASVEDQEFSFRYARGGGRIVFVPDAIVAHRHADSPLRYFQKKMKIAFWKVRVMLRHPDKIISDSHTPQQLKAELLCALAATVAFPLGWTVLGHVAGALAVSALLALTIPLTLSVFRRDPIVGLLAPLFQILRAEALAVGSIAGLAAALLARIRGESRPSCAAEDLRWTRPRNEDVTEPVEEEEHELV